MRDFFIRSMEQIINVFVIIGAVIILITAISMMFSPYGGFLRGVGFLIAGGIYLVLMAGAIYLGLGIYENTKRTAEAVERLSR